ncbi:MAG: tRNA epoxyqueuosine(34) reductase QueG [Candidatus Obscuribacterales bacterium]|nr:tRNA epoxyqueuosine(34) reductase QueG [Candidatus Obscuribacterales bacterium]
MSLKQSVVQLAASKGFSNTVIGALEPMTAELEHYRSWLERGFAAGMEYMKRNPEIRSSPQLLYPGSKSAIIVSVSYYTEKPPAPGPFFGSVARYAVGLDYHAVIRRKLRELRGALAETVGVNIVGKAFTDDVALYEQGFAGRSGLGFAGKNTLIIGPKLSGSYNFVAELFVDVELEPDIKYRGTCGQCFRCGDACPTNAIVEPYSVDANRCISYLTIENKDGIPLEHRSGLGGWVYGCDICQEVCPYNQKPPITPWEEFQPHSGVGHYLYLPELLDIQDDDAFRNRFGHTPLRRPRRRGLLRNALVVLGNQLRQIDGNDQAVSLVVQRLSRFSKEEADPMLKEHAEWALAQL